MAANVEFRFGPIDGKVKCLLFDEDSIVVSIGDRDYLYKRTSRCNDAGLTIYQYIMELRNGSSILS